MLPTENAGTRPGYSSPMTSDPEIEDRLLSDEYFEDPYPLFEVLRNDWPVYWSDKLSSWLISRHDDCETMLGDHETYSSFGRVAYLLDQLPADMQTEIEPLRRHYSVGLAHSDPPMHTRLRAALREIINPNMARNRRERVRTFVVELLDAIEHDQPLDFIESFAFPLPATVVAELLGAPRADIPKFKAWADDIAGLFEYGGRMSVEAARAGVSSLAEIRSYVLRLLDAARGNKDDTVIGALANPDSKEQQLSEQEMVSTLVTLFVAGHETTTNLLGLCMKFLLDDPQLANELRQDPTLIPNAVREFLRYEAIVPRAWRMATRDIVVREQTIHKGEMVMAMLGSANRDPRMFSEPDSLDIHRSTRRNFGFGAGIHICMGAPLARVEAEVALQEILGRFQHFDYAGGEVVWRRDMALRGLTRLPMVFRSA